MPSTPVTLAPESPQNHNFAAQSASWLAIAAKPGILMFVIPQVGSLLALPVSVDLTTAGRAFGLGRTRAFELAKAGEFPCRVLRVGIKYRVPRAAILEALGVDEAAVAEHREPNPAA